MWIDIDLEGMPMGQGHDTFFTYWEHMREIFQGQIWQLGIMAWTSALTFWDIQLGRNHDKSFRHAQLLSGLLFKSNMALRSNSQDTYFDAMCLALKV